MGYSISIEISPVKEIVKRIDGIRRHVELTQEKLAKELGISQPAISKYLKDRLPPADVLIRIARLGDTTVEWILTGKKNYFSMSEKPRVEDNMPAFQTDADLRLASKVAALPTEARLALEKIIDLLLTDQK